MNVPPGETFEPPTSPARVRAILEAHGIAPKRSLGQNFLTDANVADKIVRLAGVTSGTPVVEVGPGLGMLTLALTDAGATVVAVEKDAALAEVLRDVVAEQPVRVEVADALSVRWADVLGSGSWTMVSNLPYNVAATLVVDVLADAPMVDRLVVMTQREVGERLAATAGDAAYGALSVKVASYGSADVVAAVPPSVFVPRPRVSSVVVRIDRHAAPPVGAGQREAFTAAVTAGFATRRKTLRNALGAAYGTDVATAALAHAGIDPGRRAEELDVAQWVTLAQALEAACR